MLTRSDEETGASNDSGEDDVDNRKRQTQSPSHGDNGFLVQYALPLVSYETNPVYFTLCFIHRRLMGHVFGLWQEVRTNYFPISVISFIP